MQRVPALERVSSRRGSQRVQGFGPHAGSVYMVIGVLVDKKVRNQILRVRGFSYIIRALGEGINACNL